MWKKKRNAEATDASKPQVEGKWSRTHASQKTEEGQMAWGTLLFYSPNLLALNISFYSFPYEGSQNQQIHLIYSA